MNRVHLTQDDHTVNWHRQGVAICLLELGPSWTAPVWVGLLILRGRYGGHSRYMGATRTGSSPSGRLSKVKISSERPMLIDWSVMSICSEYPDDRNWKVLDMLGPLLYLPLLRKVLASCVEIGNT